MSTDDLTAPSEISEPISEPEIQPAPVLRARTRWAGIVWGLVLAALAAAGIWLTGEPGRVEDLTSRLQSIDATTSLAYGLLALGGLVMVSGLVGLLRRAQRTLADRAE